MEARLLVCRVFGQNIRYAQTLFDPNVTFVEKFILERPKPLFNLHGQYTLWNIRFV